MLYRIYQIVVYNSQFSTQQVNRLNSEIANINEKIAELKKPQIIDEKEISALIKEQEQRIIQKENEYKLINSHLKYDNNANYVSVQVKLKHHDSGNSYWCYAPDYCHITFPNIISSYLEKDVSFKIEIKQPHSQTKPVKAGNAYPKFNTNDIKSVDFLERERERKILQKQKQNIETLGKNKWIKILTQSEITERTNQISTLEKRIQKIETQIRSLSNFGDEIEQFKPHLEKLRNSDFAKKINFKKLVRFQPSMTYIQNIQYRNAFRYYQEILNAEGIDISIFGLYEQITTYGIREMPQVFELWSLVSIIRILESTFSFKHNPNDLKLLINSISPQNKKIETYIKIDFLGELKGRKVALHYQMKLSNGKIPDFVLEISCGKRKIFVVLDAKFKNYKYKISATKDLEEMKNKYHIDDNHFVFTIHPCKDFINEKGEPIKITNHGGSQIYFSDNPVFPFHKFGYLMIKPNETDNLKKIIGMSFEYLLENSHQTNDKDPKPEFDMICINCAGDKFNEFKGTYPSGGSYYKYSCLDDECKHEVNISYCWNCKTKLFKHGNYWDYHKTSVWSAFDIHCPNCGMTVADRPKNT